MRRPRASMRQIMIAIAVIAALLGIYMHLVRDSLRPSIGFVGSDGSHWSRKIRTRRYLNSTGRSTSQPSTQRRERFSGRNIDNSRRSRQKSRNPAREITTAAASIGRKSCTALSDRSERW